MAEFRPNTAAFARLDRVLDPSPSLRSYAVYRRSAYQRQAKSGKDAYGRPYRSLTPAYARAKARKYPGRPILEATGAMNRSHSTRVIGSIVSESLAGPAAFHQQRGRSPLPDDRGIPQRDEDQLWNAIVSNARRLF